MSEPITLWEFPNGGLVNVPLTWLRMLGGRERTFTPMDIEHDEGDGSAILIEVFVEVSDE